jgi:enoyl-CoA hydratase/carnithine racemase
VYEFIAYEVDDPVATIRLNRPERLNAFTIPMLAEIRDAVRNAEADRAVVGIVITGTGRGFCAGLDAGSLADAVGNRSPTPPADDPGGEVPGLFTYLLAVPKPVIAAINGVAAGGGFVLCVMCDIRFASTAASFTTVFSKRGLIAEHGTSWIVPRLVGPGQALDLLWSSRRFDADEAHRIGLVEHLAEPDDLVPAARRYIEDLAANVSPASIADTKRLVYSHMGAGYEAALREAHVVQEASLHRPDATEGSSALLDRRPPRFPRLGA